MSECPNVQMPEFGHSDIWARRILASWPRVLASWPPDVQPLLRLRTMNFVKS